MTWVVFFCNFCITIIFNVESVDLPPKNITAFSISQKRTDNKEIVFRQIGEEGQEMEPPGHTTTTAAPQVTHDCVCSKIYDPVCATNEKSYYNLCQMECDTEKGENVTVLHQGNCIPF